MKVPFVDLKKQYAALREEIDAAIAGVLETTLFVGGNVTKSFERKFAELHHARHCISTSCCTDALFIILKVLGIGVGDEVITAANTCIPTSEAISLTGACPVFVDIWPDYTLDPTQLKEKITPKTKAIIPVHLYGYPAHIREIKSICDQYGLWLVEDCAQAHLTKDQEQFVGTFGHAGAFSFYPSKNLGAYGNGGAILTNDDSLAEKFRCFANHGGQKKNEHFSEGMNSRLDALQAAILLAKLPHLDRWTRQRNNHAAKYRLRLASHPLSLPVVRSNVHPNYHLFVIRTKERDSLKKYLQDQGIQTEIHYPLALPNLPAYSHFKHKPYDFPLASQYQNEILSLPIFPELSEEQLAYVCESISNFF